ncbi:Phosphotyrosyl phosphatase activator, PTPA [Carpediemonas membranifera]|uniref:Serine/threonine-protein phosphatase 2A activator n=1 Tax=Carpediemonas membranifera TaxID=201153 RepID=A0A8J6BVI0_9EUKA|nr:Phosphotyrosyl phosphatase activator, PTPA [Carpediemonas membranifera]|eukprot:KAG9391431.1 Phosphotyrosyl phosphatase activator, PTPA [Carpediemonas membranifera]
MPTFIEPEKKIHSANDMSHFKRSTGYKKLCGFMELLTQSVQGMPNSSVGKPNENTQKLLDMIDDVYHIIDDFPPHEKRLRFGNGAFVEFYEYLETVIVDLHKQMLPEDKHDAIIELAPYFMQSMGQPSRIDYGTGHELSFITWLFILMEIGFLTPVQGDVIAIMVFNAYLTLVRRLQTQYTMEPAGSHGVWGLDDFQHAPFIIGASQLIDNPLVVPEDIRERSSILANAEDYMYFDAVKYITESKSAYLGECAPILYDVSSVKTWNKICEGMMKMWRGEVLDKFVVVQHLLFGSVLAW